MEFQYDPASDVVRQIDSRRSMGDVDPSSPTIEMKEEAIHQVAVKGLASRARQDHGAAPGESSNIAAEQELLEIQAQLSRENDALKIEMIQQKCEALAGALVGEAPTPIQCIETFVSTLLLTCCVKPIVFALYFNFRFKIA